MCVVVRVCAFKCAAVLFLRGFVYFVLRPNGLIFEVKSCSCILTEHGVVGMVLLDFTLDSCC